MAEPVHLVEMRWYKNGSVAPEVVRESVCGEVLPYSVAEAEIEPAACPHVSAFELALQTTPQGREGLIGQVTCEACKAVLAQEALERAG